MSGYEGRGDYFVRKQAKLVEQQRSDNPNNILNGCKVHINGHVHPSHDTLKTMALEMGAFYQQYPLFGQITHLITEGLSKQRAASLPRHLIVVKPDWLIACQREGRRVSEEPYRLYHLAQGQQTLKRPVREDDDENESAVGEEEDDANDADDAEGAELDSTGLPSICTGACPDTFLATYLQQSRLHWLSHWRQEAKRLARSLMAVKKGVASNWTLHVDLDCFFAAVAVLDRPELAKSPVAVAHARMGNSSSSSEIASCNYAARAMGVHNGMSVRRALSMCPELILMPYQFDRYRQIMNDFYGILASHAQELVAISCDEAYLTVQSDEIVELVEMIRAEILAVCGINASVGGGPNYLVARLACAAAKPNGHLIVSSLDWLAEQPITRLPGVGPSVLQRLPGIECLGDLAGKRLWMEAQLGTQLGFKLWNLSQGNAPLLPSQAEKPKSIGLEVTWGVRFHQWQQLERFLISMLTEIESKLGAEEVELVGSMQLRLLERDTDEPPFKRLGCGQCQHHHRSWSRLGWRRGMSMVKLCLNRLMAECQAIAIEDIRGIGIHCSQLSWTAPFDWSALSKSPVKENDDLLLRNRHGIDETCWRELPTQVQKELLQEMQSVTQEPPNVLLSTPPRPTKPKGNRDSRRNNQGMTLTQLTRRRLVVPVGERKRAPFLPMDHVQIGML